MTKVWTVPSEMESPIFGTFTTWAIFQISNCCWSEKSLPAKSLRMCAPKSWFLRRSDEAEELYPAFNRALQVIRLFIHNLY